MWLLSSQISQETQLIKVQQRGSFTICMRPICVELQCNIAATTYLNNKHSRFPVFSPEIIPKDQ
jgi:hypothetical protein